MSKRNDTADGAVRLSEETGWLVANYGPRCTLVSSASVLRMLGVQLEPKRIVDILEQHTGYQDEPTWRDRIRFALSYLRRLDRGIEAAAKEGGINVRAKTRFVFGFKTVMRHMKRGGGCVLNCYFAPSGSFSHSIVGLGFREQSRELLTLDPNDGVERWTARMRKICSVTFIETI